MAGLLASLLTAALLAGGAAWGETVGVKVYRLGPGDPATAETWPARLLLEPRIAERPEFIALNTAVVLRNSRKTIAVRYCGTEAVGEDGERQFNGQFGWVPPTANWYHDGFFWLRVNGAYSYHYPFQFVANTAGESATARFTGRMPAAQVDLTFSLRAGDDKLLLNVSLTPLPGQAIKSAAVYLNCYPSDFAVQAPETRRRAILTTRRELLSA